MARMPEHKKATLKEMLSAELDHTLKQRPDLTVVKIADGARDNWTYLNEMPVEGEEILDFYHACEHLNAALICAYGDNSPERLAQFEKLRILLRDHPKGNMKVIRALIHLCRRFPRRSKLRKELTYFRKNVCRMRYAKMREAKLPIGSGVIEATCKTLATQRMKRAGMRWRHPGGQAILTFRSLAQSHRFHRAWGMLADTYKAEVALPSNVIPFPRKAA